MPIITGHPCKIIPFGFPYDLTGLGPIVEPSQLRMMLGSEPNNAFVYISIFVGLYVIIFAVFLGVALSRSNLVHAHYHDKNNRNRRKKGKQMIVSYDETNEDIRTDYSRVSLSLGIV
uniref:Uncharacterized protein n=1 Tax=Tetranychus urticae TaxID=32264 RepID=T1KBL5_TETUR